MFKQINSRPTSRALGMLLLIVTALTVGLLTAAAAEASTCADADYEDWRLCATKCASDDDACIVACTDDFNRTQLSSGNNAKAPFKLQPRTGTGFGPLPLSIKGLTCPEGYTATAFPMPVYDEIGPDGIPSTADDGLFVDYFVTVWYCLPDDLEPEG